MKYKIVIGDEQQEQVLIYAHKKTKLIEEIERLLLDNATDLIGYKDKSAVVLKLSDVYCFLVQDNQVYALTENEQLQLKFRLYQVEEKLPESFIKINQSCIANIKKIERFDTSISGSLRVRFKNGYTDYVSRRQIKNVKERLGF